MEFYTAFTKLNHWFAQPHSISLFKISAIVFMSQVRDNKLTVLDMFQKFRSYKVIVLYFVNIYCIIPSIFYSLPNCLP